MRKVFYIKPKKKRFHTCLRNVNINGATQDQFCTSIYAFNEKDAFDQFMNMPQVKRGIAHLAERHLAWGKTGFVYDVYMELKVIKSYEVNF